MFADSKRAPQQPAPYYHRSPHSESAELNAEASTPTGLPPGRSPKRPRRGWRLSAFDSDCGDLNPNASGSQPPSRSGSSEAVFSQVSPGQKDELGRMGGSDDSLYNRASLQPEAGGDFSHEDMDVQLINGLPVVQRRTDDSNDGGDWKITMEIQRQLNLHSGPAGVVVSMGDLGRSFWLFKQLTKTLYGNSRKLVLRNGTSSSPLMLMWVVRGGIDPNVPTDPDPDDPEVPWGNEHPHHVFVHVHPRAIESASLRRIIMHVVLVSNVLVCHSGAMGTRDDNPAFDDYDDAEVSSAHHRDAVSRGLDRLAKVAEGLWACRHASELRIGEKDLSCDSHFGKNLPSPTLVWLEDLNGIQEKGWPMVSGADQSERLAALEQVLGGSNYGSGSIEQEHRWRHLRHLFPKRQTVLWNSLRHTEGLSTFAEMDHEKVDILKDEVLKLSGRDQPILPWLQQAGLEDPLDADHARTLAQNAASAILSHAAQASGAASEVSSLQRHRGAAAAAAANDSKADSGFVITDSLSSRISPGLRISPLILHMVLVSASRWQEDARSRYAPFVHAQAFKLGYKVAREAASEVYLSELEKHSSSHGLVVDGDRMTAAMKKLSSANVNPVEGLGDLGIGPLTAWNISSAKSLQLLHARAMAKARDFLHRTCLVPYGHFFAPTNSWLRGLVDRVFPQAELRCTQILFDILTAREILHDSATPHRVGGEVKSWEKVMARIFSTVPTVDEERALGEAENDEGGPAGGYPGKQVHGNSYKRAAIVSSRLSSAQVEALLHIGRIGGFTSRSDEYKWGMASEMVARIFKPLEIANILRAKNETDGIIERLRDLLVKNMEGNERLSEELEAKQKELEALNMSLETAEKRRRQCMVDADQARTRVMELEDKVAELTPYREMSLARMKEVQSKADENEVLRGKTEELQSKVERISRALDDETVQLKQETKNISEKYRESMKRARAYEVELLESREKLSTLRAVNESLQARLERTNKELARLQKSWALVEEREKECQMLKKQIENLKSKADRSNGAEIQPPILSLSKGTSKEEEKAPKRNSGNSGNTFAKDETSSRINSGLHIGKQSGKRSADMLPPPLFSRVTRPNPQPTRNSMRKEESTTAQRKPSVEAKSEYGLWSTPSLSSGAATGNGRSSLLDSAFRSASNPFQALSGNKRKNDHRVSVETQTPRPQQPAKPTHSSIFQRMDHHRSRFSSGDQQVTISPVFTAKTPTPSASWTSQESGSSMKRPLKNGTEVVIQGLEKSWRYNGLRAVVIGERREGRYPLMVESKPKPILVKSENLIVSKPMTAAPASILGHRVSHPVKKSTPAPTPMLIPEPIVETNPSFSKRVQSQQPRPTPNPTNPTKIATEMANSTSPTVLSAVPGDPVQETTQRNDIQISIAEDAVTKEKGDDSEDYDDQSLDPSSMTVAKIKDWLADKGHLNNEELKGRRLRKEWIALMRKKMRLFGYPTENHNASTIHSSTYKPTTDEDAGINPENHGS